LLSPCSPPPYRGRFAPSPTGPLHLGSLIAALASYLDARSNKGAWLVRIDDLDPPREVPGAAQSILASLVQHGLRWDEDVLWQSRRTSAYRKALTQLKSSGKTFLCDCTRAMLGPTGNCQKHCWSRQIEILSPAATRIRVPASFRADFVDQLQGPQCVALGQESDNFLIHRKDGLFAYQLAVVVDDAHQEISHTVRGSDLLDTTARQIFIQQSLACTTPSYCHIPVITNELGQKFSKQNHAPTLNGENAAANLRAALQFLGQPAPPDNTTSPEEILKIASQHWSLAKIPPLMSAPACTSPTPGAQH